MSFADNCPSDYSMHPLESITVSTSTTEAGLSHGVPRYSGEPDPFKHATDVSQCVTCGAQITVSHRVCIEEEIICDFFPGW